MNNKLKRIVKEYFLLFITFLIISIFSIMLSIKILNLNTEFKTSNSMFSKNGRKITIEGVNDIDLKHIKKILEGEHFILETFITNEGNAPIVGVFFNQITNKNYPIVRGRVFDTKDFKSDEKLALVGYDILKKLDEKNSIKINGSAYKIVGVLGNKKGHILNDKIYINLNSTYIDLSKNSFSIENLNGNTKDLLDKIYKDISYKNKGANLSIDELVGVRNSLLESIKFNKSYIIILALLILCLMSTVVNISYYWVENQKKLIALKRLVGGTNKKILLEFWKHFECVVIIASVVGSFILIIFNKIKLIDIKTYNFYITFEGITLVIILNLIISTLTIIPLVIKLKNVEINNGIKEGCE